MVKGAQQHVRRYRRGAGISDQSLDPAGFAVRRGRPAAGQRSPGHAAHHALPLSLGGCRSAVRSPAALGRRLAHGALRQPGRWRAGHADARRLCDRGRGRPRNPAVPQLGRHARRRARGRGRKHDRPDDATLAEARRLHPARMGLGRRTRRRAHRRVSCSSPTARCAAASDCCARSAASASRPPSDARRPGRPVDIRPVRHRANRACR